MKKASTAPEEHTHNRADETVYLEKERKKKKKRNGKKNKKERAPHLNGSCNVSISAALDGCVPIHSFPKRR